MVAERLGQRVQAVRRWPISEVNGWLAYFNLKATREAAERKRQEFQAKHRRS